MTDFQARERASAPLRVFSVGWVPSDAVGTGGQVAPSRVQGTDGPAENVGASREVRRDECKEMKGAQHGGTVRGFGAMNGSRERGRRR